VNAAPASPGLLALLASAAELVRLRNALFGAAYACLGAYLAVDLARLPMPRVLVAALVVLLVIACGNVANDYRDAAADAIAKPERPIPSGRISKAAAARLAVGLGVASVVLAFTLGVALMFFALCTVVVGVAYSYLLKEIPLVGNASVGLLCGAILVFGGLAAGALTPAVAVAGVMTGLFVFAQEIFYTVEDEPGDRSSDVRTTATWFGRGHALTIFKLLALVFVSVAIAPSVLGLAPSHYLYVVLVCTVAPTVGVIVLLGGEPSEATIRRASQLTRLVWLSSIVTILVLKEVG
jgi:geranylgeranylglycerol-phosphate geranylgeranyltransferase